MFPGLGQMFKSSCVFKLKIISGCFLLIIYSWQRKLESWCNRVVSQRSTEKDRFPLTDGVFDAIKILVCVLRLRLQRIIAARLCLLSLSNLINLPISLLQTMSNARSFASQGDGICAESDRSHSRARKAGGAAEGPRPEALLLRRQTRLR